MTLNKIKHLDGCLTSAFISPKVPPEVQVFANDNDLKIFEEKIGKKLAIVLVFFAWDNTIELLKFPKKWCDMITKRGSIPHITWEPWDFTRNCKKYDLDSIINGKWDKYINEWANDVSIWGKPILLRWGHEMNGSWYPWDGMHNKKDPQKYINAYIHIKNIFDKANSKNVIWVWAPDICHFSYRKGNIYDYLRYYPGDEYVDIIGIDGYNFYHSHTTHAPWRTFDQLYSKPYEDLTTLSNDKPLMIGEFASNEDVNNKKRKSEWILDAFSKIKNEYKKIKIFTWFNIDKEADWRVDSSPQTLTTFRQALSDPYFKEKLT